MKKAKVLVLCTGNSCRSQIAEGFLRYYAHNKADIYSAGIEKHGVNPMAIATMQEIGIDISMHSSNLVEEYQHIDFDFVISVCDHAKEQCPYFASKAIKLHHSFPDPAKAIGTEKELNKQFAAVRELIQEYCKEFMNVYIHKESIN